MYKRRTVNASSPQFKIALVCYLGTLMYRWGTFGCHVSHFSSKILSPLTILGFSLSYTGSGVNFTKQIPGKSALSVCNPVASLLGGFTSNATQSGARDPRHESGNADKGYIIRPTYDFEIAYYPFLQDR